VEPSLPGLAGPVEIEGTRRALRRWFRDFRRDLPWRRSRDPYAIWISEVMLQQTTVATVIPRWERFLLAFPTLERLAAASEEKVLAEWSGLGYYSRARNLHAAARTIGRAARFPRTAAALEELPGFGAYTAAAVASMAFGESVAAVDTNVERVLSRFLGVQDRRSRAGRRRIREAAMALVPRSGAGDHNQALMELGATVCRPLRPNCAGCPLAPACSGLRTGDPSRFDGPSERRPTRRLVLAAGLARRQGRLVLVLDREMVRGHLTLPFTTVAGGDEPAAALRRQWADLTGRTARRIRPAGRMTHAVLDRRYSVHLFTVDEGEVSSARRPVNLVREESVSSIVRGSFLDKALAAAAPARGPAPRSRPRGATGKKPPGPSAGKPATAPGSPPRGAARRRPTVR
jgi:A/G-specific adenine glycosylase